MKIKALNFFYMREKQSKRLGLVPKSNVCGLYKIYSVTDTFAS